MSIALESDEMRNIMMLRGLGYPQHEIAEKMGVELSYVSYRLKVIRKHAREEGDEKTFKAIWHSPEYSTLHDFGAKRPLEISAAVVTKHEVVLEFRSAVIESKVSLKRAGVQRLHELLEWLKTTAFKWEEEVE